MANTGKDVRSFVLGNPEPGGFYENFRWRLREAVSKKAAKLGRAAENLVLVLDFDLNGYDMEDVPAMREELMSIEIPFAEVWAADLREPVKLDRLWPSTASHK